LFIQRSKVQLNLNGKRHIYIFCEPRKCIIKWDATLNKCQHASFMTLHSISKKYIPFFTAYSLLLHAVLKKDWCHHHHPSNPHFQQLYSHCFFLLLHTVMPCFGKSANYFLWAGLAEEPEQKKLVLSTSMHAVSKRDTEILNVVKWCFSFIFIMYVYFTRSCFCFNTCYLLHKRAHASCTSHFTCEKSSSQSYRKTLHYHQHQHHSCWILNEACVYSLSCFLYILPAFPLIRPHNLHTKLLKSD